MKNVASVKKIPSHLESVCFRTKCCYFASRICLILENYQISQTEPNAGMQTDNNVFIRLSTLSALKEEIILFGPRDRCILKIDSRGVSFASKFPCRLRTLY